MIDWKGNPDLVAKAKALWDEGLAIRKIAAAFDLKSKNTIIGLARRHGWSSHAVKPFVRKPKPEPECKPARKRHDPVRTYKEISPTREAARKLWLDGLTCREIGEIVDKSGPTIEGWRRKDNWPDRKRRSKSRSKPVCIPLREVYRWGADLGVELSKRGNVEAVSDAMRRAYPSHPGFVLADVLFSPISRLWV